MSPCNISHWMPVLAVGDGQIGTVLQVALPAAGVIIGSLGSEVRNWMSKRAELKAKDRADSIQELTGVITTIKQEYKDACERHAAAIADIRGQHADCQEQYATLKKDHDDLKKAHDALSDQMIELKRTVQSLAPEGVLNGGSGSVAGTGTSTIAGSPAGTIACGGTGHG